MHGHGADMYRPGQGRPCLWISMRLSGGIRCVRSFSHLFGQLLAVCGRQLNLATAAGLSAASDVLTLDDERSEDFRPFAAAGGVSEAGHWAAFDQNGRERGRCRK